jgi:hypothetical protein
VRRPLHHTLIVLVSLSTLSPASAATAPTSRRADKDAAYLQEAFSHDLCTRNDRELHTLAKALSKKPGAPAR